MLPVLLAPATCTILKRQYGEESFLPGGFSFLGQCLSHTKCPLLGSMLSTETVFSPLLLAWGQRVVTRTHFSFPA